MVVQHLLVERRNHPELHRQRRRSLAHAGVEIARDLAGQPRPPLRAAADHHGVGTSTLEALQALIDDRTDLLEILIAQHGIGAELKVNVKEVGLDTCSQQDDTEPEQEQAVRQRGPS